MNQPATLPPGLPPLPPVPPGFDRWEYRGKGFTGTRTTYAHTHPTWGYWYLNEGCAPCGINAFDYIEAVREPAVTADDHAADLREFIAVMNEPANEPAAGEPSGVEARVCDNALAPFQRVARGIPDNWPGECILRFDQRADGSIFLSYYGANDASGGITISEWRKLLEPTTEGHE